MWRGSSTSTWRSWSFDRLGLDAVVIAPLHEKEDYQRNTAKKTKPWCAFLLGSV
jgi:hypothetical protein